MDIDLDKSVCILGDTLSSEKGLSRKGTKAFAIDTEDDYNISVTLAPHELKKIMISDRSTLCDEATVNILQADKSFTGNIQVDKTPWKTVVDGLYLEFFSILQNHSGQNILDVVSDFTCSCSDALKTVQELSRKFAVATPEEEIWLEKERNTWRLLFILYQDRFLMQNENSNKVAANYLVSSEKLCVENLFKEDSLVREIQLIVDWLECNAAEKDDEILTFSDNSVGWENTLHQLQFSETIAFGCSRPIVTHMDPDTTHYEKKPLHDLDMEDEKRISKKIFYAIRCGKLEEAQKLCRQCGHSWKAGIFEGWRLFHDTNSTENVPDDSSHLKEIPSIQGNSNRDIWKSMAIRYSKQEYINLYDKATVGSFCGFANAVLAVCKSWDDYLWAYMKCMVDIRVESEIRDYCIRNKQYSSLPTEYWAQRMSLSEVFLTLESSKNPLVRKESCRLEYVIQKYIILDEIPSLLQELNEWIKNSSLPSHYLRFIAHLVLFLDQIGQGYNRNIIERILESYIKRLMQYNEGELIPFYISKLDSKTQIDLYSQYLQEIVNPEDRKKSLTYAENNGLNVLSITRQVVENIRKLPTEIEGNFNLQQKTTDLDKYKISALDWLRFYEIQKTEALIQTNALVFSFLTLGKLDAAQLSLNKLSTKIIEQILSEGDTSDEVNQAIKEYFSYKIYIDAIEAFNEWFKQCKTSPIPPAELPENAEFSEKVAYQHKSSQYKAEFERWKLTTAHLAKTAKTFLYNVLLFPEGWLISAKDGEYLRSLCLPEVVLLLYSVLCESGEHVEAIQLADIIASEKHGVYKLYSKEKLEEILMKLSESSVLLLNMKNDAWGNYLST